MISQELDSITIERGEDLVVWLNRGLRGDRNAIEVILRVDRHGQPELTVSHKSCKINDLDNMDNKTSHYFDCSKDRSGKCDCLYDE